MYQYITGTYWTSGLLSYGRSVVLKSITIINNKPGVSNVIPWEQRKKKKKWNQKNSAKHLEELPKCMWKGILYSQISLKQNKGDLMPTYNL